MQKIRATPCLKRFPSVFPVVNAVVCKSPMHYV